MNSVSVTDKLSVGPQPDRETILSLYEKGYRALVNLRPNNEEVGQLGDLKERAAARDAGLSYTFVPVTMSNVTEGDVHAFQAAVTEADGPVFAHCKSGTRALALYAIGEVLDGRMAESEVASFGSEHGIDLSGAVRWLERANALRPQVKGFFDPRTSSIQYVVFDPETRKCVIIDPVLDYEEKSGATSTKSADLILSYVKEQRLKVEWILDTHPHADHMSAARYLREHTEAPTAIGDHVTDVQRLWRDIYNWPDLRVDGSQWDRLFSDGETFKVGSIDAKVMFSPGHTLASVTYVIGDAAFVHDTIFMPDSGTARADFPGGDARMLWRSIGKILELPDETRVFTGHDYQPGGRSPRWESTVADQKRSNPHLAGISENAFVELRSARDRSMPMPKLILHALQVNIMGGRLPEPEANGRRYLRIPLDALQGAAW